MVGIPVTGLMTRIGQVLVGISDEVMVAFFIHNEWAGGSVLQVHGVRFSLFNFSSDSNTEMVILQR